MKCCVFIASLSLITTSEGAQNSTKDEDLESEGKLDKCCNILDKIPNGQNIVCRDDQTHCSRYWTSFAVDFFNAGSKWTRELCEMDSDNDGATNGEELGDPCCTWEKGDDAAIIWRGLPGQYTTFHAEILASMKCTSRKTKEKIPNGEQFFADNDVVQFWVSSFGKDFSNASMIWTKELCEMDSDEDGATNGEELGDPCCRWQVGGSPMNSTIWGNPMYKNPFSADELAGLKCENYLEPDPNDTQRFKKIPNGENLHRVLTTEINMWPAELHVTMESVPEFWESSFGTDFIIAHDIWTKELCAMDSDKDGMTNGEELGDPCCEWKMGDTPKHLVVSHPGSGKNHNSLTYYKCNSAEPNDARFQKIPNGNYFKKLAKVSGDARAEQFVTELWNSSFGDDFYKAGESWTKELCEMDSDEDGDTNGAELGDPCCEWKRGDTPKRRNVRHPGINWVTYGPFSGHYKCDITTSKSTDP
jgi:hypothetical protein